MNMKQKIFSMLVLLIAATGVWAQDPIDLTPSADYKTWTLAATPEYDVELEVEYDTGWSMTPSWLSMMWTTTPPPSKSGTATRPT